jgi:xylan 1,4-beta-xylosidase
LTDAWRACVGTGRFDLALRRDYQDSLALVQREIGFRHIRGHGLLSDAHRRDALREAAEPVRSHRRPPIAAGRVTVELTLARHEVTLVELTPVIDETPPWWQGVP